MRIWTVFVIIFGLTACQQLKFPQLPPILGGGAPAQGPISVNTPPPAPAQSSTPMQQDIAKPATQTAPQATQPTNLQEPVALPAMQMETSFLTVASVQPQGAPNMHRFVMEIAQTPEQKARGLMFRTQMADDHGMLFPFSPPKKVGMWMKNTKIPLDILFVDERGFITQIHAKAEPMSETPIYATAPVTAVVEIKGGMAKQLGIKTGDRILHPMFVAQ